MVHETQALLKLSQKVGLSQTHEGLQWRLVTGTGLACFSKSRRLRQTIEEADSERPVVLGQLGDKERGLHAKVTKRDAGRSTQLILCAPRQSLLSTCSSAKARGGTQGGAAGPGRMQNVKRRWHPSHHASNLDLSSEQALRPLPSPLRAFRRRRAARHECLWSSSTLRPPHAWRSLYVPTRATLACRPWMASPPHCRA